jgi:hypothetical protein
LGAAAGLTVEESRRLRLHSFRAPPQAGGREPKFLQTGVRATTPGASSPRSKTASPPLPKAAHRSASASARSLRGDRGS